MSEKSRAVAVSSRRFIGVAAILLLAIAVVVLLVRASFEGTSVRSNALSPQPMNAFSGGTFEASGVVQVPGTEAVLFVDDGRTNEIFWMRLGEDRKQSGAIKTIDIGTSIIDLEGITTTAYISMLSARSRKLKAAISSAWRASSSTPPISESRVLKPPLDSRSF